MTTITAIEIGEASSLALTRVARFTGRNVVELTVVEGVPALTLGGKVIATAEQASASITLDLEQWNRLIAADADVRAWLGGHRG